MEKNMCGLVKESPMPGDLVYHTDLPLPTPKDDEVLIKIHCTAVCGTDLHIMEWDDWSQHRVKAPIISGHETAGDIVAVGKNVTERKVGDRVSCETHISCNHCWFCKHGLAHICKNVELLGVSVPGAFAEYMAIRWDSTFLLDDSITMKRPACSNLWAQAFTVWRVRRSRGRLFWSAAAVLSASPLWLPAKPLALSL